MRILVIGGTIFLGRHITEAALAAGHDVTLFNRGQHDSGFGDVTTICGDRTKDLELLNASWNVVIDTCGYFPRDVKASASALSDQVDRYIFISTLSVFADLMTTPNIDENGDLAKTDDPEAAEVTGANYGALKALCEMAIEEIMPGRTLVIRPGLIVGPFDSTDRFTYWPVRLDRGDEVLAPAPLENPVQVIDARDLASWIVRMAEGEKTGIFNATGPQYTLTMGDVLAECKAAAAGDSNITWVDSRWLVSHGVQPWIELPLWLPDSPGFARVHCQKAYEGGLTFRGIDETVRDTLAWARDRPDHEWKAGLKPEQEREILQEWHGKYRSE